MGFTGMVLGAMFQRDGFASTKSESWAPPDGKPHFPPKAKSVIWIFLQGGLSHLESFDPKPALNRYAGKSISETPFKDALDSPLVKKNVVQFTATERKLMMLLLPLQVGYRKRAQSGIEISDWWPHLGEVHRRRIRYSLGVDHRQRSRGATAVPHRPPHLRGVFSIHWLVGPLWSGQPQRQHSTVHRAGTAGSAALWGVRARPEETTWARSTAGVHLAGDPLKPLPYASPELGVYREEQEKIFDFVQELNRLDSVQYPADPTVQARIKSYELAFRMQTAVPELFRFQDEPAPIHEDVWPGPGAHAALWTGPVNGAAAGGARRPFRAGVPRLPVGRGRLGRA